MGGRPDYGAGRAAGSGRWRQRPEAEESLRQSLRFWPSFGTMERGLFDRRGPRISGVSQKESFKSQARGGIPPPLRGPPPFGKGDLRQTEPQHGQESIRRPGRTIRGGGRVAASANCIREQRASSPLSAPVHAKAGGKGAQPPKRGLIRGASPLYLMLGRVGGRSILRPGPRAPLPRWKRPPSSVTCLSGLPDLRCGGGRPASHRAAAGPGS